MLIRQYKIYDNKYTSIQNKVWLEDHGNNNPLNVTFDANNVTLINYKNEFGDYMTDIFNDDGNKENAINEWMGGSYRFINYTLTCDHYDLYNYLEIEPGPNPPSLNQIENWINNIDMIFNNQNLPIIDNSPLITGTHGRYNILQDPEIVNVLNLFQDNDPNWFLTYRCTRYFNIRNMMIADHNNVEFLVGQKYRSTSLISSSYSPYINWNYFQDSNNPFMYLNLF